jgi:translation initiation factor IF-2
LVLMNTAAPHGLLGVAPHAAPPPWGGAPTGLGPLPPTAPAPRAPQAGPGGGLGKMPALGARGAGAVGGQCARGPRWLRGGHWDALARRRLASSPSGAPLHEGPGAASRHAQAAGRPQAPPRPAVPRPWGGARPPRGQGAGAHAQAGGAGGSDASPPPAPPLAGRGGGGALRGPHGGPEGLKLTHLLFFLCLCICMCSLTSNR